MEDKVGKIIIFIVLTLVTSSLWAKYPFSRIKDEKEIVKLSKNVTPHN